MSMSASRPRRTPKRSAKYLEDDEDDAPATPTSTASKKTPTGKKTAKTYSRSSHSPCGKPFPTFAGMHH